MPDSQVASPSQETPAQNQPVTEQPQQTPTEFSSLARMRAAAQQVSAPAAAPSEPAGQPTPSGTPPQAQPQRSEYIPRERFDQVNAARQAAEAKLAALQGQYGAAGGLQPVAQQPAPQVSHAGMVQPQAAQNQAVANSPQVQRLLDQLTNDKAKQEEWRKKIASNPVTGLAEFVQHAIQTEGSVLLQQALAPIVAQLAPLQQNLIGQRIGAYAAERSADPTWQQVQPHFEQLAYAAAQRGYSLTPQSLQVVEAVARQQAGLNVFGAPMAPPPPPPPFTERPGNGGANFGAAPAPSLTPQQLAMAQKFKMTPQEYAADLAKMTRSA